MLRKISNLTRIHKSVYRSGVGVLATYSVRELKLSFPVRGCFFGLGGCNE